NFLEHVTISAKINRELHQKLKKYNKTHLQNHLTEKFSTTQTSRITYKRKIIMQVPKDQVTIILPTLNEEKAIGQVIEEIKQQGYTNIIVVDGYSKDKTVEVAKEK
ncbi:MAG: glycosyltransferase, partial [Nitrososphaeria archaeon]